MDQANPNVATSVVTSDTATKTTISQSASIRTPDKAAALDFVREALKSDTVTSVSMYESRETYDYSKNPMGERLATPRVSWTASYTIGVSPDDMY